MTTSSTNKQIQINAAAIFFGALIGIGFWITLGILGGALGMSIDFDDNKMPSGGPLAAIAVIAILMLTSTFLVAGFIASKGAHQQARFDSIIHSLGAWAVMAVLLVMLISSATIANAMRTALNGMNLPAIVTDINVFEGKAVTKVKGSSAKDDDKPTLQEKQATKIFALVWWISFTSLLFGLGTSVVGGLIARKTISGLD